MLRSSQFPLLLLSFVFNGQPTKAYSGGRRGGYVGSSMDDWHPLSLGAGGKAERRLFATSSTLSKLTPLYFHPRSRDRRRPERRCKNKRDVWISPHKRLTTHARRVALFCLYLGILEVSCHLKEASGRASDGILGYWEADEWSDRWTIRMWRGRLTTQPTCVLPPSHWSDDDRTELILLLLGSDSDAMVRWQTSKEIRSRNDMLATVAG